VNGSQSKFLAGTWPMSQNQPETPLFYLGQDRLTIDKLSAFGTGLGTAMKHKLVLARPYERSTTKIDSKNSLSPLRHFTEHLVGEFVKLPRENDLDHESLRLLIRWLKSTAEESPATNFTPREQHSSSQAFCRALGVHK
jgi:hypothetical protein